MRDYSVLLRLGFERKPVGVKFLITKPEGIPRLDRSLNFCEMFREAQNRRPFWVGREDFECVEPFLLGMEEAGPMFVSGLIGEREGFYEEARANRAIYYYLPKMIKGSVRYVAFSALDVAPFDPDVTIFTADQVRQAQLLLRAATFSTGEAWSSQVTPVAACAWLYVYPVLSGRVNFTVTGLSMGMQSLKVLPDGLILVSIPWQVMPRVIENLQKMKWENPGDVFPTRDENRERVKRLFRQWEEELTDA
ncbi:MAG: DUF169 domain-containing protein [Clostridia bacterium]|nr:DUF169 domain-containing protein [Clostridia bacterium]MDH7574025.1 DUF169 domain-containing protein [Clostridia bacterium]